MTPRIDKRPRTLHSQHTRGDVYRGRTSERRRTSHWLRCENAIQDTKAVPAQYLSLLWVALSVT